MDLRPDPIQERLAEAVDDALAGARDPAVELAAIGVPSLCLPSDVGGFALGLGADVIVCGRLGYSLETLPAYRETLHCLELAGASAVPDDVRDALLDGSAHAVLTGAAGSSGLRTDPAGRLWGESEQLPEGNYRFVAGRAPSGRGSGWFVAVPDAGTCRREASSRLDVPHVRLAFHGTPTAALDVEPSAAERAAERARVRQAAVLHGIADRALECARTHVNRRNQYGAPLLDLQSVAHRLATLVGDGDGWRLMLHETAWRHDRGEERPGDGSLVLAVAAEHALTCARLAIQLHGARGMLAHSMAAATYRAASVEATRMGPPQALWAASAQARRTAGTPRLPRQFSPA